MKNSKFIFLIIDVPPKEINGSWIFFLSSYYLSNGFSGKIFLRHIFFSGYIFCHRCFKTTYVIKKLEKFKDNFSNHWCTSDANQWLIDFFRSPDYLSNDFLQKFSKCFCDENFDFFWGFFNENFEFCPCSILCVLFPFFQIHQRNIIKNLRWSAGALTLGSTGLFAPPLNFELITWRDRPTLQVWKVVDATNSQSVIMNFPFF